MGTCLRAGCGPPALEPGDQDLAFGRVVDTLFGHIVAQTDLDPLLLGGRCFEAKGTVTSAITRSLIQRTATDRQKAKQSNTGHLRENGIRRS
jgi:hypothetical protein